MKKRNRLESYRKNAKNGSLDKIASENQGKNPPNNESDESIRKDSVRTEEDMTTLSFLKRARNVEESHRIVLEAKLCAWCGEKITQKHFVRIFQSKDGCLKMSIEAYKHEKDNPQTTMMNRIGDTTESIIACGSLHCCVHVIEEALDEMEMMVLAKDAENFLRKVFSRK